MSTKFAMTRDINGYNGFGLVLRKDTNKASVKLDLGVLAPLTVPSNYKSWIAIIGCEPGTTVWVANNEDAELPSGNSFSDTTSIILPAAIEVEAGDILSFITSNTTAQVGVAFYAL